MTEIQGYLILSGLFFILAKLDDGFGGFIAIILGLVFSLSALVLQFNN